MRSIFSLRLFGTIALGCAATALTGCIVAPVGYDAYGNAYAAPYGYAAAPVYSAPVYSAPVVVQPSIGIGLNYSRGYYGGGGGYWHHPYGGGHGGYRGYGGNHYWRR